MKYLNLVFLLLGVAFVSSFQVPRPSTNHVQQQSALLKFSDVVILSASGASGQLGRDGMHDEDEDGMHDGTRLDREREDGGDSDDDELVTSWEQLLPGWYNGTAELSLEQIELIRMSWDSIKYHPPGVEHLVSEFYDRIWVEAPQLKKLFNLDMAKQHGKFSAAFDLLVRLLDTGKRAFSAELKELVVRHAGYGARARDYPVFVTALLYSIEQYSPLLWSPALLNAWMDMFSLVLAVVMPTAWELEQKAILSHTLEGGGEEEEG
eukprot:CAMPEP_0194567002 /NCGR_PEP_ID=MMETSP0292-20121207/5643_1 /TAXON_ID=39354 /ORGANISM="Heterosigma akashiwo, Strain CCMP2393" /LENGTH=263 /DNA_ID=CAMNT_0039416667 /DNA_START=95 /DNA_END=886 /DNA_ORIENTATION=+